MSSPIGFRHKEGHMSNISGRPTLKYSEVKLDSKTWYLSNYAEWPYHIASYKDETCGDLKTKNGFSIDANSIDKCCVTFSIRAFYILTPSLLASVLLGIL